MKLRLSAVAMLIVCFIVVFLVTAAAYGSPLQTSATNTSAVQSPAISLGQPGLSFRYVQTFGVTETPYISDTTHLNRPQGLFIDGSNNLYVVEEQGNRLLRYNSSGVNTLVIGKAGMNYTDDYVFSTPADVALDTDGNIWVADNSRVVQYTPTGVISQSLPARDDSPWNSGNTNGRFDNVHGLAFDSVGRMYVSDSNNHRIQVYDMSTGSPVYNATIGVTSVATSTNAGFNNPQHIAIAGNLLYVADAGNQRVQILDISSPASPIYVATLGVTGQSGSDNDHFAYPAGVAVDANYIYVAEGDNNRVQIFNRTTRVYVATLNTGGWGHGNDQFWNPFDVAVDSAGNIYVADRFNYRVQEFNSSRNYTHTYGTTSVPYLTDNYHYNHPRVAIDSSNNIIVLEESGQRLIKLDSNGVSQWSIGVPGVEGNDNTHLWWPHGVATDKNGNIYVADNTRVQIFKSNGTYSATLGTGSGTGNYEFGWATGIDVDKNGNIYVVDYSNQRVQIYNSSLTYLATLGETGVSGSDNSHFNNPIAVDVDASGNIYVTDGSNLRVQKFNSSRVWQMTIGDGTWGDSFNQLAWPEDVVVDAQGRIFVTDWSNNRVQVFDSTGAYLTTIDGAWGANTSQFRGTSGVDVDSQGNVYVADFANGRIQKFAPGVPGWRQKNINGFGERWNGDVLAMTVFNGQLYAGVGNWNDGAQVWRTSDGSNWTAASVHGLSNTYTNTNPAVIGMAVFNNQLYAGTGWGSAPGQLWRSPDGTTWSQITGNDTEDSFGSFVVYSSTLYAGTCINGSASGVQIWRSATGDSLSWTNVVTAGNTTTNNTCVTSLMAFNGALYAITENSTDGAQIWRTTTGDTGTWTQVNTSGFGSTSNDQTGGFAIFNGNLCVGTRNNTTGAQLWCSSNGTTWTPVMTNGFGDVNNSKLDSLFVFENALYAGLHNSVTGMEVWRSTDGVNWSQINPDGFGDSNTDATVWSNATVVFNNSLYLGVNNYNGSGGKVWQLLKQVYLPAVIRN